MLYAIINLCGCERKLTSKQKLKRNVVIFLVAICLPFVTKIYITLIASVRCYTFKNNFRKFFNLKNTGHNYKDRFPQRESIHNCSACKDCDSETLCFCLKCGLTSMKITANKYASLIRHIECNAMDLTGLNRYISSAVEDTYMPLWQTFMILPIVAEKFV